MLETILYFGSFNPVHLGHISLAESVLEITKASQLWFIVSPQNPFKTSEELANEQDRLNMVRLAIEGSKYSSRIFASDVEFAMDKPSRSIDTIHELESRYPDHTFSLLIGSDNVDDFDKWKDYLNILENYKVLVYPRDGYKITNSSISHRFTYLDNLTLYPQAASSIRNMIKESQCTENNLNINVVNYIRKNKLYGFTE